MQRFLCSVLATIIVTACGFGISHAQANPPATASPTQSPSPAPAIRHSIPRAEQRPTPGVALVNNPIPDYLFGEVSVRVVGNQNPIIRLGLAPGGVTLVEFPAADRLFAIHPGDSNLVTVDESGIRSTDRFITIRPGSGFSVPSLANRVRRSVASIMVQMQSGMVMTFLFYPVPALAENAHRVVVMYSKDEVVAQRRAAGLTVNLDGKEQPPAATASTRVAATLPITETPAQTPAAALATAAIEPGAKKAATPSTQITVEVDGTALEAKRVSNRVTGDDSVTATQEGLRNALKFPQQFTKWSAIRHGLSVSTSQVQEIGDHSRLIVIAVRNTLTETIRLLPGHPELLVQTYDEKSRPLELTAIKKLQVQSSAIRDAIPAGTTVYYAIAYEAPILGANQQLRISVGQTNAADEPLAADLNKAVR